ncbi:MAG: hypothetical protein AUK44_06600 [Porphyromonadaceae bacterium CG2_30_38_12]|nr:MAG: hypothetical protein AUK44_06600 [Porphyromonadaceae bacterium CG2_30_38_12]
MQLAKVSLFVLAANTQAQTHCATVIELTDGYYTDKVWLITEPGTTNGFDNGWDGRKFLNATTPAPQIFDRTVDGDFQVSSFPTIENHAFAIIPGKSSILTMKLTHYDIDAFYNALYIIDMQDHDTIDVYTQDFRMEFESLKTDLVERFKFITKLPEVVQPDTTTAAIQPPVENPVVDDSTEPNTNPDGITTNTQKDKNALDANQAKNVKVSAYNKKLRLENLNTETAYVSIINASNGVIIKKLEVNPQTTVRINMNTEKGLYIVKTNVTKDFASKKVAFY